MALFVFAGYIVVAGVGAAWCGGVGEFCRWEAFCVVAVGQVALCGWSVPLHDSTLRVGMVWVDIGVLGTAGEW